MWFSGMRVTPKAREDYLLKCPICGKKMWLSGANQHRAAKHGDVREGDFKKRLVEGIESGRIEVRRFGEPDGSLVSGTQRLRQASRLVGGVRSVVSGGKVP